MCVQQGSWSKRLVTSALRVLWNGNGVPVPQSSLDLALKGNSVNQLNLSGEDSYDVEPPREQVIETAQIEMTN